MNFINNSNFQNDALLIAVGIVGAFGALVIIYTNAVFGGQNFFFQNDYDIDAKKSQILAMVQTKNFLTGKEKDAIIKELIGEKVKMFSFTDNEIEKILSAVNNY